MTVIEICSIIVSFIFICVGIIIAMYSLFVANKIHKSSKNITEMEKKYNEEKELIKELIDWFKYSENYSKNKKERKVKKVIINEENLNFNDKKDTI